MNHDDSAAAITTHSRYPQHERDRAYTTSYRTIRLVVGVIGALLPIALFAAEPGLDGDVHFRGSLSAYYHTPMQVIFVGALCVVGFLLGTYLAGEWRTWDFWVSLAAGAAVLGVVFFPTSRPGAPGFCAADPAPPSCSFVELAFPDTVTTTVHGACAAVFIACLAVLSLLFATAEKRAGDAARHRRLFVAHTAAAVLIVAAGVWAFVGSDIGELTALYLGEVAAVWSFAASWLLAGLAITAPPRAPAAVRGDGERPPAHPGDLPVSTG